jgi:4-amino-4-deoxy-L-arabinose transferase-like glycosyltransferase
MNKARVEAWVWVLVYGGLLTVAVSVFVLRAADEGRGLGWLMLVIGVAATAAGVALVVVRARMEKPVVGKKGHRG